MSAFSDVFFPWEVSILTHFILMDCSCDLVRSRKNLLKILFKCVPGIILKACVFVNDLSICLSYITYLFIFVFYDH